MYIKLLKTRLQGNVNQLKACTSTGKCEITSVYVSRLLDCNKMMPGLC